jgi:hypothetical protein
MARTPQEKEIVNRALMSNGLGKLDDPGLVRQLGFLVSRSVKTHDEFRTLINRCDPAERPNMYEALKPYIRFELKPLDVYIAENFAIAEAKQLPTIGPDGQLVEFKVPEIRSKAEPTALQIAQRVINDSFARFRLSVFCPRCTREAVFTGLRREDALEAARAAGWRMAVEITLGERKPFEICPQCVDTRASL